VNHLPGFPSTKRSFSNAWRMRLARKGPQVEGTEKQSPGGGEGGGKKPGMVVGGVKTTELNTPQPGKQENLEKGSVESWLSPTILEPLRGLAAATG